MDSMCNKICYSDFASVADAEVVENVSDHHLRSARRINHLEHYVLTSFCYHSHLHLLHTYQSGYACPKSSRFTPTLHLDTLLRLTVNLKRCVKFVLTIFTTMTCAAIHYLVWSAVNVIQPCFINARRSEYSQWFSRLIKLCFQRLYQLSIKHTKQKSNIFSNN